MLRLIGQRGAALARRVMRMARRAADPLGRRSQRNKLVRRTHPLLARAARLYRATVVRRARLVAIVGSLGKTSTAAAVAAALSVPRLTAEQNNSPGRVALRVLAARPWHRCAVVEVGVSRSGLMAQHARMMRPDLAVVTSIASEHHRTLGTLDDTAREKAQILGGLRPGGVAVLNGDDPRVRAMAASYAGRVITFGFGKANDVRPLQAVLDWPRGTWLSVQVGGQQVELTVALFGRVMLYPVLAALAVAWAEGRPLAGAAASLASLRAQPGRLEPVPAQGGAWLLRDEFKSTLEWIDAAFDLLAEIPARRMAVLGEISEPPRSQGPEYRRLGARLASTVSMAVILGPSTAFKSYQVGATRAGMERGAILHAGRSVHAAADLLRPHLRPGDVLLVKGRDTQRLDRAALLLQGRNVICDIEHCYLNDRCAYCPALRRVGPPTRR